MRRNLLFFGLALVLAFAMGCNAPQYQPCCAYANATQEAGPFCYGGEDPDTGEPWEWELAGDCDEEAWACEIYLKDEEGNPTGETAIVPMCPKLDEVQCNTTCVGIFCGSFRFDPRPNSGAMAPQSSYKKEYDMDITRDEEDIPPKPAGLTDAECRVQNISPRFMRYVENSGSVVLNTFRFGIGNSFQDTESAQAYFPLVDEACGLNDAGSVERFYLYAIPNQETGGELCSYGGAISPHVYFNEPEGVYMEYVCNSNRDIYSMNYFDCASRCTLDKFHYPAEIDPYYPYPTYADNCGESEFSGGCARSWGNPFAYGLDKNEFSGDHRYEGIFSDFNPSLDGFEELYGVPLDDLAYRGVVSNMGGLSAAKNSVYIDDYPFGTTLYGATFSTYPPLTPNHPFMGMLANSVPEYESYGEAHVGKPYVEVEPIEDYYSANKYTNNISQYGNTTYNIVLDWIGAISISSVPEIETIFTTTENDPRPMFAWLLSHHSVYNEQFKRGHYSLNGSHEEGAEFECDEPQDCKSNYCNNFDYSRAACVDADTGEDILCDCQVEAGGVVCRGTKTYAAPAWDDPSVDIELSRSLPAPVSDYENPEDDDESDFLIPFLSPDVASESAKEIAILPSLGSVEMLPVGGEGLGQLPIFVLHLGGVGKNAYWDEGQPLPSYEAITQDFMAEGQSYWTGNDGCAFFRYALNPTSAGITKEDAHWSLDHRSLSSGAYNDLRYPQYMTIITPSWIEMGQGWDWLPDAAVSWQSDTSSFDGYEAFAGKNHKANDDTPCIQDDYEDQRNRYLTRFVEQCLGGPSGEYVPTASVCISKSAEQAYGLEHDAGNMGTEHIDGWSHDGRSYSYWDITVPDALEHTQQVCSYIRKLAEPDDDGEYPFLEDYEKIVCYEWDNGERKFVGGDCTSEALSFLVVVPRVVEEGPYAGRLAFGRCLLNEDGDDLEMHRYGICESCGYLTMAKEHIVALPENSEEPEGLGGSGELPWNMYCPDTVLHTPQPLYSLLDSSLSNTNDHSLYDWRYLLIGPWEQSGFSSIEQGSMEAADGGSSWQCTLPNGEPLIDAGMDPSGLPYTEPNSFYITRKLESFLRRNIQPVLFADDPGLWVAEHDNDFQHDTDFDTSVLKLQGGSSTSHLMSVLYKQRPALFAIFAEAGMTSRGAFLGNSLLNQGPIVLVLKVADGEEGTQSTIRERARATRLLCPNCATSVAFGYEGADTDKPHLIHQARQIASVFNYTSASTGDIVTDVSMDLSCRDPAVTEVECNQEMLELIDVISVKIVLQDGDYYCGIADKEEKFAAVLADLSDIGVLSLRRYDTPVLITDFIIDRSGSCWGEEEAGELLNYIAMNRQILSKSGVTGIIYGDWESTEQEATGVR
ncbi:hypothetical protein GF412_00125, partial [Candidatus Micrarchaeota archaeon]|nr:hypothetical protein [Candidatus Micrarchaeota archaeon]MBD3417381.1 hypothetical protein [Candidatus Micrarchaeota archaeon]